jgi:hypothetical protein
VVKWLAKKSDVGASDKQGASVVRLGKNGESRRKTKPPKTHQVLGFSKSPRKIKNFDK